MKQQFILKLCFVIDYISLIYVNNHSLLNYILGPLVILGPFNSITHVWQGSKHPFGKCSQIRIMRLTYKEFFLISKVNLGMKRSVNILSEKH